jgi:hypothetical protein
MKNKKNPLGIPHDSVVIGNAVMVMGKEAGTHFARANGIKAMYLERA